MPANTYIITLKDAIRTELKNADLVDKNDIIIFLYPQGNDSISLKVHQQLKVIKAKTEFKEVSSSIKNSIVIDCAYLAGVYTGQGNSVSLISEGSEFTVLEDMIPIYPDFNSAIKGVVRKKTPTKKASADKPVPKTAKAKTVISAPKSVVEKVQPVIVKTPAPRGRKPKAVIAEDKRYSPDDLRDLLSQYESNTFCPQNHTMNILEAGKASITKDLPFEQCIKDAMMIDSLAEGAIKCLKPHYSDVLKLVKKIIESK